MWSNVLSIYRRKVFGKKSGFGIMEVMVSILVLGFLYAALNQLQKSNDEAVHRLRCRDGAIQVAQEIMDSLKAVGSGAIESKEDQDNVIALDSRTRTWERGLGGVTTIEYTPELTVSKATDYVATNKSNYESNVQHVYAKQVSIKVSWRFKATTQSINVSGVIR